MIAAQRIDGDQDHRRAPEDLGALTPAGGEREEGEECGEAPHGGKTY
jgi:hypothetical protein